MDPFQRHRWLLPASTTSAVAIVLLSACAERVQHCGVTTWRDGCNALPLGLDRERYAEALAYVRGYDCSIASRPGDSLSDIELRIAAANEVLPRIFRRNNLPWALIADQHFQRDSERMARDVPCE